MPAILRIFLYQTDASLSLLGLCGSYGQVGVRTTRSPPCRISWAEPESANIIGCRTVCVVCVSIGPLGLLTVGLRYPLLCLVYCPEYLTRLV
jgi:hypothetical protein